MPARFRKDARVRLPAIAVDAAGEATKQKQILAAIAGWIADGILANGARLPSTRDLALDLGVSRNTIVAVYEQLAVAGLVRTKEGSGAFVQIDGFARNGREGPSAPGKGAGGLSTEARRAPLAPPYIDALVRPFALGVPEIDGFPLARWQRSCAKAMRRIRTRHFGFGDPQGLESLRSSICSYVSLRRGVRCSPSQIVVVSGAQQAFDLIGRLLIDPDDYVVHEEPGYFLSRGSFSIRGARIAAAPVDSQGADPHRTRVRAKVKFVYLTPSHQQPLGMTMPYGRRADWLDFAKRRDCWIVEDDFDSEFRYDADPVPALQHMDSDGRVVYIGSFSKSMFPGIRLGFMVLPETLVAPCVALKSYADGFTSTILQEALAEFLASGGYAAHVRKMRGVYRDRYQSIARALTSELGHRLEFGCHEVGLHITGVFRDQRFDDVGVCAMARDAGIELKPLSIYYCGAVKKTGLIFGFAAWEPNHLRDVVDSVARLLDRAGLSRHRAMAKR